MAWDGDKHGTMQWEIFVNGTTVGKLGLQSTSTLIVDDEDKRSVVSSKKSRSNLIGSALHTSTDSNASNAVLEHGQLTTDRTMQAVSVTAQVHLSS